MAKKEMVLIDYLRKKGAVALKFLTWPFQLNAINRSFDRVSDEAVRAKDKMEQAVLDIELDLISAKEDDMPELIKKLAAERRKYEASAQIATDLPALRKHLFETVITVEEEEESATGKS